MKPSVTPALISITRNYQFRYDSVTMPREPKNPAAAPETPAQAPEPPHIYIRACGALCDVFWWARRSAPAPKDDSSDRARDESTPAAPPARS